MSVLYADDIEMPMQCYVYSGITRLWHVVMYSAAVRRGLSMALRSFVSENWSHGSNSFEYNNM